MSTGRSRETSLPRGFWTGLRIMMAATSLLYLFTTLYGQLDIVTQRGILMGVSLVVAFLLNPLAKGQGHWILATDLFLALLAAAIIGYLIYLEQTRAFIRPGAITPLREIIAWALVILVIEATRRLVGWPLALIATLFILYGRFGAYFPGLLYHPGAGWDFLGVNLVFSSTAVFGTPAYVAATVIIVFTIFGAFLKGTGSRFFLDIPMSLFGKVRGGPAKIAVVGSAIMGTVTGSTVANVATVGTFTIPLMKQTGYSSAEAGAIEALTSTGSQMMPPVMGSAAFVMADLLGITYWQVCAAAFLPSCLYYLGLFLGVDFKAVKRGLKPSPSADLPSRRQALLSSPFLLPVALLIFLLGVPQWSPMKAGFFTIVATLAVSMFYPKNRLGPRRIYNALVDGTKNMVLVAVACACAGIIIGVIVGTGIGIKVSAVLIGLSHGNMFILLLLSAVVNLILGMGMPTLPCYLFLVFLIAPALVGMGMLPLQAHMFIFFYAGYSAFTPPVAIAAYAAGAIAKEDPIKVAWQACQMGLITFVLPFIFAYNARLLFVGSIGEVIPTLATTALAVLFFISAIEGISYWIGKLALWQRAVFGITAILVMMPNTLIQLVGLILVSGVFLMWLISRRHARPAEQPSS